MMRRLFVTRAACGAALAIVFAGGCASGTREAWLESSRTRIAAQEGDGRASFFEVSRHDRPIQRTMDGTAMRESAVATVPTE